MNEDNIQPKKPIFKRCPKGGPSAWFWLIAIIIIIALAIIGFNLRKNWQFTSGKDNKFITAMPFDPSQIAQVSYFRSCMGHDYSSFNIEGVSETKRSMKHYVQPLSQYNGQNDKVKLFAPFDGTIANIQKGKDELKDKDPRMGGWGVDIYPKASPAWTMELGHVYLLPEFKVGSEIKSGQLIGYAYVQPMGSSFDLPIWTDKKFSRQFSDDHSVILDSIFNHMTDDVLSELKKYNLTKDDFIISKDFRDAHLCQEQSRGVNANGENEVGFIATPDDKPLAVEVNFDANLRVSCNKNADCPSGTCEMIDLISKKGFCK